MTRERIHTLVDLVLDCKHWGLSNRSDIYVDNDGDHWVNIYLDVGKKGKSITYVSDAERFKEYPDDERYILDPNFDAAEARLRYLLLDLKGESDA